MEGHGDTEITEVDRRGSLPNLGSGFEESGSVSSASLCSQCRRAVSRRGSAKKATPVTCTPLSSFPGESVILCPLG
jgi:hypothetical protein